MATKQYAPVTVPEGYVNPDKKVKIRLLHLPGWIKDIKFRSTAFVGGEGTDYKATIETDSEGRLYARAEVPIGVVDPATYQVTAVGNDGFVEIKNLWLLVEEPHDGKVFVTGDKSPKPNELVQWQFSGLTRNAAYAYAWSPLFLGSSKLKTVDIAGEKYQAIVYHVGSDNAHQGFVVSPDAKPGQTYPVKIAQEFRGGHKEIIVGEITVPADQTPRPGKQQFTVIHKINLSKVGEGDNIVHKIEFGDSFKQTNTNYAVLVNRKTVDAEGKPVKPNAEEAAQLAMLDHYHFVRHTHSVELHTRNPHKLRGNTRFKPIYIVTIFPVEDDSSYDVGDDE